MTISPETLAELERLEQLLENGYEGIIVPCGICNGYPPDMARCNECEGSGEDWLSAEEVFARNLPALLATVRQQAERIAELEGLLKAVSTAGLQMSKDAVEAEQERDAALARVQELESELDQFDEVEAAHVERATMASALMWFLHKESKGTMRELVDELVRRGTSRCSDPECATCKGGE